MDAERPPGEAQDEGQREEQREEQHAESDDAASGAGHETRAPRSVEVRAAAAFGALLGGIVALMQGSITLTIYGVSLGRAGFVTTWVSRVLYAGRGLVGLVIMAVAAATIGALMWAIGALLYNVIARLSEH